ncbi:MAG: hypothetical protein ACI4PD_07045 [Butyricicoccus sp.]
MIRFEYFARIAEVDAALSHVSIIQDSAQKFLHAVAQVLDEFILLPHGFGQNSTREKSCPNWRVKKILSRCGMPRGTKR